MSSWPYLPWLDCVGPGFSELWDQVYNIVTAAVVKKKTAKGTAHDAAALSPHDVHQLLPWHDIARAVPDAQSYEYHTLLHHRVLHGDLHPKHLNGHCHLGIVLLKHLADIAYLPEAPQRALAPLGDSWKLLMYPLGEVTVFDFLESSRWNNVLSRDALLQMAASQEEHVKVTALALRPPTPVLRLLAHHSWPAWQCSALGTVHFPLRGHAGYGIGEQADRYNLTAVAVSTHAAVLEPVASLRAQLSTRSVRLFAHFLGVLHPSGDVPCELLPQDTRCGGLNRWGDDAVRYLYDLGDLRSEAFKRPGFIPELTERAELILRRHVHGRADLVVCAHPFLLCALLRALTPLFLLVYLTPTPLALVPETDRPWVLGQMASLAGAHASTAFLAASPLYALHALYQTGVQIQPVRPSSIYVAERHRWQPSAGDSQRFYLWALSGPSEAFVVTMLGFIREGQRQGVPWLREAEVTVKELLKPPFASWDLLGGMRCVVLLPWDLQLTVFPELYALGVPLVLPSASYAAAYGLRVLEKWQAPFWAVHPRFAGRLPGLHAAPFAKEPWVQLPLGQWRARDLLRAEAHFLYWAQASDFETFGHLLRFDSVPEMLWRAAATPASRLAEVHAAMRAEWADAWRSTASAYEEVVQRVVAWVRPPSPG